MSRLPRSLRLVLRNKRFAALAVLSLSLAIALNTTMYSVLDALIRPNVEMHQPSRLYNLGFFGDYLGRMSQQARMEQIRELRSFAAVGGSLRQMPWESNIVEKGSRVAEARIRSVSDNYFALVGVRPMLGRVLGPADAFVEPRPVVVGERFWKRMFPEATGIDGATVLIDGAPRRVIGVLSYAADFPGAFTDVWQLAPASQPNHLRSAYGIVRLKDGVELASAEAELKQLSDRWAAMTGQHPADMAFRLTPAVGEPFRFQAFHLAMIAAVVAVLLVACTNLANLQIARGITRAREFATRAAVGASRRDLITQVVQESAWIAGAGLALGLVLTFWGMRLVEASVPDSLAEFIVRPQVSWRLFAAAAVAAVACIFTVGVLPAIRISRVDINDVLKSGAGTGRSVRARRGYGALVVVQVGLALALMVGGTLLIRSAAHLYRLDYPAHFDRTLIGNLRINPTVTAPLDPSVRQAPWVTAPARRDPRRAVSVADGVLARVRALPDVENAAVSMWRSPVGYTVALADPGGQAKQVITGLRFSYMSVSSEYPRVAGMMLHRGRLFSEGEFAEPLVIVDDRTARFLWPGEDPIGKRIKLGRDTARVPWLEVIGVVRHFNFWSAFDRANQEEREAPRMGAVFVLNGTDSVAVGNGRFMELVVRARRNGDALKLPFQLQAAVRDAGAGVTLPWIQSWLRATRLETQRERNRFVAALFTVFAIIGMSVAALGVYAIVSHSVSQRTREFGVRIALGARASDIRRTVLREGNILALSGIALGLILASRTVGLLGGFLRSDDDRFDSPFFALIALVLLAVALAASWVPARRAMRINPVEALKND